MSHSFIKFNEKYLEVHDDDLASACFIIIDEAKKINYDFDAMFEDWYKTITEQSGFINLRLNKYLATDTLIKKFLELIDLALVETSQYPDDYPKEKLAEHFEKICSPLTDGYPSNRITGALRGLKELFTS